MYSAIYTHSGSLYCVNSQTSSTYEFVQPFHFNYITVLFDALICKQLYKRKISGIKLLWSLIAWRLANVNFILFPCFQQGKGDMQVFKIFSANGLLSVLVIFSVAINYSECLEQGNSTASEFSEDNADFGDDDDFSDASGEQL